MFVEPGNITFASGFTLSFSGAHVAGLFVAVVGMMSADRDKLEAIF